MKPRRLFWLILILTLLAIFVDLPAHFRLKFEIPASKIGLKDFKINQEISRPKLDLKIGKFRFYRDLEIKQGIDLAGGAHLVFQADMSKINEGDRDSALEAAKNNIERRINLFGVTEPVIQSSKLGEEYRLIVELAGVSDINQAVDLIGRTAQLDFRELPAEATQAASFADFKQTELTGKDLTRSRVQFDSDTGKPVVGLEFSPEGAKKFSEITKRNIGKPLAIFLDEWPLTTPLVKEEIPTGQAVITGEFSLDEAKRLSIQLNAGALPVPIKIIEQRNVGASLGADSVRKSLRAGIIGLLMVAAFMIAYYGYLGFLATCGLVIYGLLTLALYKLIPVTLTLPGVAGFLLSIGMAVDSNILIFERMKEEIWAGKPKQLAMELGFGRAWDSIRDANVCTLITCFILFNPFNWTFLNTSGMVRGFALTLGLGVLLSLFTGIVVTRTILRVLSKKEGL
ncbi:MAG: protein translocase subunit SecD [Microgenomates group bacterium]